jgi:hypothetical protein
MPAKKKPAEITYALDDLSLWVKSNIAELKSREGCSAVITVGRCCGFTPIEATTLDAFVKGIQRGQYLCGYVPGMT